MIGGSEGEMMSEKPLDPSRVLDVATGFWPAKTLLSAVELDLFTSLGDQQMTGGQIGDRLGIHPRALYDFLDALVALRFLERDGEGPAGRYRNSADAAAFLDEKSPVHIVGFLKMINARLYRFWGDLTEALTTGKPQNEAKYSDKSMFDAIYGDPAAIEQFLRAMAGITVGSAYALAEKFDFTRYRTFCDVGGAMGQLCIAVAQRHPHLHCISYDLSEVAPVAEKNIAAANLSDRITVASGDFFAEPLPHADVIAMGRILHDWNLQEKMRLIKAAYDALPEGGAFVAMESLIDDGRRENVFGLMMSLNMLIESDGGFDFSGRDFAGWAQDVGFRDVETLHLAGVTSAAIAYK
jgi:hypothetical protein